MLERQTRRIRPLSVAGIARAVSSGNRLKYARPVGLVWSLIYGLVGVRIGFTIGANEFFVSVAMLCSVFLLPLPATIVAWCAPKAAAVMLLLGVAIAQCISAIVIVNRVGAPIGDMLQFAVTVLLYCVPHVLLALAYLCMGSISASDSVENLR